MAIRHSEAIPDGLRYEPTPKWVRAEAGGEMVADTRGAVLVWEPGHVVPLYAIPRDDLKLELFEPAGDGDAAPGRDAPLAESWVLEVDGRRHEGAAWSYGDDDLAGYVALDWGAMDRWLEEEEEIVGHPRDPFHRIDVRRSSRHVVVRLDGELLAESRRASLLLETGLPVRFYMPFEDARDELLVSSPTQTVCAYKGRASHWSAQLGDRTHDDVAWSYPEPLADSHLIAGLLCFYDERTDICVDGEQSARPQTPWSPGAG